MQEKGVYLPNEVLFQILVRLPVKSLLRFRCVCKFWNSRLSKFNFIVSHSHIAGKHNVLLRNYLLSLDKEIYTLHSDNHQFEQLETLNFPFKASSTGCFTILGCVNGLVCLWDKDNVSKTTILWNPAIRKCFTLPTYELKPPTNLSRKMRSMWQPFIVYDVFGFGYDASSNDFKVVRILFHRETSDGGITHDSKSTVVIFSLRRKSWRTLECAIPLQWYSRSCTVGRFVCWMTQRYAIMCFDLSSEVFTHVAGPGVARPRKAQLMNFRDSLALLQEWRSKRYRIWVMKDDGVAKQWTEIFRIDLDHRVPEQCIIGFTMTGKLLVVGDGHVLVYPVVEDVQVVKYVPSSPQHLQLWDMELFKESLFLLKEGDNLPLPSPILGSGN